MSDDKIALRRTMRSIRRVIADDPAERAARSVRIWQNVLAALVERAGGESAGDGSLRVMLFDSLPTEPDSSSWKVDAGARGWRVHVPEADGDALLVMPGDVDPASLDVVVVPGLAFTADGRRLGQGGGHYDRFLVRLSSACLTVGVCFHEQLVPDLPIDPHDVPVLRVVTDRGERPSLGA